jgi:hypothetical protein
VADHAVADDDDGLARAHGVALSQRSSGRTRTAHAL